MKAYWWGNSESLNVGDQLTKTILRDLYQQEVEQSPLHTAELAGAGSLLGWIWENQRNQNRTHPLHIVGSGFMTPDVTPHPLPFLRIHSVRGRLSADRFATEFDLSKRLGDPGVLAPRVAGVQNGADAQTAKYGLILHHKYIERPGVIDKFNKYEPDILDVRTDNVADFLNQMQKNQIVLSQSLHGLIFADALGIPNVWLNLGGLHSGGFFKFLDYFSSIGRDETKVVTGFPQTESDIKSQIHYPQEQRIKAIAAGADEAFREALSQIPDAR